jgi:hypothetical protein
MVNCLKPSPSLSLNRVESVAAEGLRTAKLAVPGPVGRRGGCEGMRKRDFIEHWDRKS